MNCSFVKGNKTWSSFPMSDHSCSISGLVETFVLLLNVCYLAKHVCMFCSLWLFFAYSSMKNYRIYSSVYFPPTIFTWLVQLIAPTRAVMPEAVQTSTHALHPGLSEHFMANYCPWIHLCICLRKYWHPFLPQNYVNKQNYLEAFNSLEFEELPDLLEHAQRKAEKKKKKRYNSQ